MIIHRKLICPHTGDGIQALALRLDLEADELTSLPEHITSEDEKVAQDLAQVYQEQISVLFKTLRGNPELVLRILHGHYAAS